jgi:hypothetical protein
MVFRPPVCFMEFNIRRPGQLFYLVSLRARLQLTIPGHGYLGRTRLCPNPSCENRGPLASVTNVRCRQHHCWHPLLAGDAQSCPTSNNLCFHSHHVHIISLGFALLPFNIQEKAYKFFLGKAYNIITGCMDMGCM